MAKRKLLLADDSMTIQKVVNLTFADQDIEVTTVGDGDAAMRKFAEDMPDLVLADVNMPGLNGYEICEIIKRDEKTKRIPVILLVGSFEPFDEEKATRVGANDFLTKPFQSIRLLVKKVSDLLEAKADEENFLRPIENPDDPVSSFADTLEMEPDTFDTVDDSVENLGDAGMDDEMIETSQVGSVPTDEARKFASAPIYQSFAEDLDKAALKPSYSADAIADYPPAEDWAKTQPLSKNDLEELRRASSEGKTTAPMNFDELDLPEFPQTTADENLDADQVIQGAFAAEVETPAEKPLETGESSALDKAASDSIQTENLSPEMIEAIADKVAERFSGEAIKQIVREVVAEMERKK